MEASLQKKMQEKGLSESTIKLYIRNIRKLNNEQPYKTLKFLFDVPHIMTLLEKYKPNTVRNYVISITAVLGLEKDKRGVKKAYDAWSKLLNDTNKTLKAEEAKNEMTETQKENWIDWTDVERLRDELREAIDSEIAKKRQPKHLMLLHYIILCLYTMIPPRRNEYSNMLVVKKVPDGDTENNYYEIDTQRFILNSYKTAKVDKRKNGTTVGTIIEIPKELQDALALYLRFHPTWKKKDAVPLLVKDAKGTPFNHVNDLTKILNSIFGKRVGSTMLRHSYLSSKYGKMREEQKNDSKMMGHSTEVQQTYIKKLI